MACHGDRHKDTFEKWKQGIELALADAEAAVKNAREEIEKAKSASEEAQEGHGSGHECRGGPAIGEDGQRPPQCGLRA